tara:strand:- start:251 stop:841 length:591 start_codon:yes stop_codon:yes gene_type:complete
MFKVINFFLVVLIPFSLSSNENIRKSRLFIENLGEQVINEVANSNISDTQREKNFSKLYNKAFDNNYISKFVLGRYWSKIDIKTQQEFTRSFQAYLVKVYAPKFKGWKGEFKTTNSKFSNNMYVVNMNLVSENISSLSLDWRLYVSKNNIFKILDVNIDGVSMLVTQRAEFASVIKNHPKGVLGLIEQMKKKIVSS